MASSKLKRRYPYLAAFMDLASRDPLEEQTTYETGLGCLLAIVTVPLAFFGVGLGAFFAFGQSFPLGLVLGIAGSFLAAGGTAWLTRSRLRRVTEGEDGESKLLARGRWSARELVRLDREKKLTQWLDPVAGQLGEAGAFHWQRVREALSGPEWQAVDLNGHWTAIREKSSRAADLAMAELLTLVAGCVGEPAHRKEDDLQGFLEELSDLEFRAAAQQLLSAAGDPGRYRHSSPRTAVIFEPAQQLARRLQSLADEVEAARGRLAVEVDLPAGAYAVESIDMVLGEMRAVRQAEAELEEGASERLSEDLGQGR